MAALLYTVISSKAQYKQYKSILEYLVSTGSKERDIKNKIALLNLLVEKWKSEHYPADSDPVMLLVSLMADHDMRAKDLVEVLKTSKGNVSDILNYKKGLSKEVIRKLADYFKVSQDALMRPYALTGLKKKKKPAGKKSR